MGEDNLPGARSPFLRQTVGRQNSHVEVEVFEFFTIAVVIRLTS
jgi:hypothetical protein